MPTTAGCTTVLSRLGSLEPCLRPLVRQPLLAYPAASPAELQVTSFRAAPCQAAPPYRVTSALVDQHPLAKHSRLPSLVPYLVVLALARAARRPILATSSSAIEASSTAASAAVVASNLDNLVSSRVGHPLAAPSVSMKSRLYCAY